MIGVGTPPPRSGRSPSQKSVSSVCRFRVKLGMAGRARNALRMPRRTRRRAGSGGKRAGFTGRLTGWLAGQMRPSGVDLRSQRFRSQMTGFDSSP